jgi:hypothetical protein
MTWQELSLFLAPGFGPEPFLPYPSPKSHHVSPQRTTARPRLNLDSPRSAVSHPDEGRLRPEAWRQFFVDLTNLPPPPPPLVGDGLAKTLI